VFVHGLKGHPRKTWGARKVVTKEREREKEKKNQEGSKSKGKFLPAVFGKSKHPRPPVPEGESSTATDDEANENSVTFWPADLLPSVIPSTRIWTYGYDADVISGLFSGQHKNSVLQHGNDLMAKLERELRSTTVTTSITGPVWQESNVSI
jgi:hypothetical protein